MLAEDGGAVPHVRGRGAELDGLTTTNGAIRIGGVVTGSETGSSAKGPLRFNLKRTG